MLKIQSEQAIKVAVGVAVKEAIAKMGIDAFKQTSFFAASWAPVEMKRAA